jgi:hypothetical protein
MPAWSRIPWKKIWIAAVWLSRTGKARLERNLSPEERQELTRLMTRSKGRRSNLSSRQQQRFVQLVRQAFFGRPAGELPKKEGRRKRGEPDSASA